MVKGKSLRYLKLRRVTFSVYHSLAHQKIVPEERNRWRMRHDPKSQTEGKPDCSLHLVAAHGSLTYFRDGEVNYNLKMLRTFRTEKTVQISRCTVYQDDSNVVHIIALEMSYNCWAFSQYWELI